MLQMLVKAVPGAVLCACTCWLIRNIGCTALPHGADDCCPLTQLYVDLLQSLSWFLLQGPPLPFSEHPTQSRTHANTCRFPRTYPPYLPPSPYNAPAISHSMSLVTLVLARLPNKHLSRLPEYLCST